MRVHLSVAATAGLLLAACAGGATGAGVSGVGDQPRRIDVEMKGGMKFAPGELKLKAGERVVIAVRNNDSVEHEFMAGRGGQGSVGYREDLLGRIKPEVSSPASHDAAHGGEHKNVGIRLGPGQTGTVTFTVPEEPGEHEFGCFIAGHYESAMKGKLTISK